jgi:hypothetical protein
VKLIRSSRAGWISLALGMFFALAGISHAATTDTAVLSVTPGNFLYGVVISSPLNNGSNGTTGYDFTQVNLGATTISTVAIHVNNAGNVPEYFSIAISNSNPDGWTAINSGVPGFNQFELLGHLETTGAGEPNSGAFNVNTDTITVSVPSTAAGRYGQATQTNPGISEDLYLKLIMPSSVSSQNAQTMTLSVNGQAN